MFQAIFSVGAFGTDTLITLKYEGLTISQRDPFWPAGIPVSKHRFNNKLRQCIISMIKDANNGKEDDYTFEVKQA